jgi:hypothetical protein
VSVNHKYIFNSQKILILSKFVGFIWVVLKNLGNNGKSQQLQAASKTEATKELFVD